MPKPKQLSGCNVCSLVRKVNGNVTSLLLPLYYHPLEHDTDGTFSDLGFCVHHYNKSAYRAFSGGHKFTTYRTLKSLDEVLDRKSVV